MGLSFGAAPRRTPWTSASRDTHPLRAFLQFVALGGSLGSSVTRLSSSVAPGVGQNVPASAWGNARERQIGYHRFTAAYVPYRNLSNSKFILNRFACRWFRNNLSAS